MTAAPLVLMLSSCATQNNYQARVRTWEGQDAKVLLKAWGTPDAIERVSTGDECSGKD